MTVLKAYFHYLVVWIQGSNVHSILSIFLSANKDADHSFFKPSPTPTPYAVTVYTEFGFCILNTTVGGWKEMLERDNVGWRRNGRGADGSGGCRYQRVYRWRKWVEEGRVRVVGAGGDGLAPQGRGLARWWRWRRVQDKQRWRMWRLGRVPLLAGGNGEMFGGSARQRQ